MSTAVLTDSSHSRDLEILTKATLRAAGFLGLRNSELASIIGVSPPMITKLKRGGSVLPSNAKTIEISKIFLRLYRSLDAIVGGNDVAAAEWIRNENTALGGVPIAQISTIRGLVDVTAYLDQRRAIL